MAWAQEFQGFVEGGVAAIGQQSWAGEMATLMSRAAPTAGFHLLCLRSAA